MDGSPQAGAIRRIARHREPDAAFDTVDLGEAAVVRHFGGLGRPRRDRADARHHQQALAAQRARFGSRTVVQQAIENVQLAVAERLGRIGEMHEFSANLTHGGIGRLDLHEDFGEAGRGESWGATKYEHGHLETAAKSCASGARLQPGMEG